MIIPIKCFTCGKVIADKYRYYQCKVRQQKIDKSQLKETNISKGERLADLQM